MDPQTPPWAFSPEALPPHQPQPPSSTSHDGNALSEKVKELGLEKVMCEIATSAWVKRQVGTGCVINNEMQAVFDSTKSIIHGKRHVLYPLRMPSNSLWIMRLYNGFCDADRGAAAGVIAEEQYRASKCLRFESEVVTMRFAREEAKIPVPEIFGFDCTFTNPLGTPYIIMEFVSGSIYSDLFTEKQPMQEQYLQKIHAQLANLVWHLFQHPFKDIGQLHFAKDNATEYEIRAVTDQRGMVYGPFDNSRSYYSTRAQMTLELEEACGKLDPSSEDARERIESAELFVKASNLAGEPCFNNGPFILQHGQIDMENVLLDDSCNIVGILGWEGAATVPVDSLRLLPCNSTRLIDPIDFFTAMTQTNSAHQVFKSQCLMRSACFPSTEALQALAEFQGSVRQSLVKCLDDYDISALPRGHRLPELMDFLTLLLDG